MKTEHEKRMELERTIVRMMIRHMKANGWRVDRVYDGGDEDLPVANETAAMEAVFDVDESTLWFKNDAGKDHGVFLVGGNGCDIISDWNYAEGDADAFGKLMDEYMDTLKA